MRFLPMITQIFLWGPSSPDCAEPARRTMRSRLLLQRRHCLLLVDEHQPRSPACRGWPPESRGYRDGTIKKYLIQPHRHALFPAPVPGCPQAGLLYRGRPSVRLVFYLLRASSPAGPMRAPWGSSCCRWCSPSCWLLPGSHDRHGRFLVPRNQLAAVRLHALHVLLLGHMFPIDMLPGFWGGLVKACRCNTWPTFRRPSSWQGHRLELFGLVDPAGLGGCFILASRWCWARASGTTAGSEAEPMTEPHLLSPVFLTFARNSLVRDMTYPEQLPHRDDLVGSPGVDEPGFYTLIFQYTPVLGSAPEGEISVLPLSATAC